jgi:hypothetical protein
MSCKVNKGKHVFYSTLAQPDIKLGPRQEYQVVSWHTCLACGERRAITIWGELLQKINGEWKEITP